LIPLKGSKKVKYQK
jgi:hypothetical protein